MKKILFLIVICMMVLSLNAQYEFNPSPRTGLSWTPNFNFSGFLHPDKVKMNHTMSFMSGMSSSGMGYYESAYTNHLQFSLRDNLKLNVDLKFANLGTMSHNNDFKFSGNNDNQNAVVPAFSLQYKPSDSTTIFIEYRQVRGYDYFRPYGSDVFRDSHSGW